jgi:hypothetical protein
MVVRDVGYRRTAALTAELVGALDLIIDRACLVRSLQMRVDRPHVPILGQDVRRIAFGEAEDRGVQRRAGNALGRSEGAEELQTEPFAVQFDAIVLN